jgi:hypothetical protein
MVKNTTTENHNILVEPYLTDGAIRANVKSGFSTIAQKSNLVGLKVIVGGSGAQSGWIAYFKEEDLHTQPWSKTVFSCKDVGEPFMIADSRKIVMIKHD